MKKRQINTDTFVGPELKQFLKHFRHGKYPGEKAVDKAMRHSIRQRVKQELRK